MGLRSNNIKLAEIRLAQYIPLMRFIVFFAVLMTCTVPAFAETVAERHALADLIAARIKSVLQDDPYMVEQDCAASDDCVISIHQ